MAVATAARVSACRMSRRSDSTAGWMDLGTLFGTFAVLLTPQHRCHVPGKTSSRAFQNPSAPSPTAISGAIARPRAYINQR